MLTVDSDATLRELAEYLATALNLLQTGCVAAVRDFDDVPQDPSAYPCLIIHRTQSEKESLYLCSGRIRYMLLNQDQRSKRPGLFRWVELAIAKLLEDYQHRPDPKLKIVNLDNLRSSYRIGTAQQFLSARYRTEAVHQLFPLLEMEIEFIDYLTEP